MKYAIDQKSEDTPSGVYLVIGITIVIAQFIWIKFSSGRPPILNLSIALGFLGSLFLIALFFLIQKKGEYNKSARVVRAVGLILIAIELLIKFSY